MNTMKNLISQNVVLKELIHDNLLYVKTRDEETTRIYLYNVIESSFISSLIKGQRFFKYSNQDEEKYISVVVDSKIVIYEPIKDEIGKIIDGRVMKVYDIQQNDFIEPYCLPETFVKDFILEDSMNPIQKKIGSIK